MGEPLYPDPYHHDRDWHNMPLADCLICFDRLAALEHKLLTDSEGFMPASDRGLQKLPHQAYMARGPKTFGYVCIIKNFGHAAGASLSHGHQQIGFSNIMPQRYFNNFSFMQRNQQTFSEYMLRENPKRLMVRDFGHAVLIVWCCSPILSGSSERSPFIRATYQWLSECVCARRLPPAPHSALQ
jgi:hypothetical protein